MAPTTGYQPYSGGGIPTARAVEEVAEDIAEETKEVTEGQDVRTHEEGGCQGSNTFESIWKQNFICNI